MEPTHLSHADPSAAAAGLTAVASGAGAEVTFVHGALGDYRQWGPIGERLRRHYTVVALSRRYHWPNPGPPPDAPYSHDSHCDDLLRYLRMRPHPVHLVGHSYGASVALLAAIREAARVRTLVLVEPALHTLLPAAAPGLAAELESRRSMQARVHALVEAGREEDASRELIDWTQGGPGGFARLADWVQRGLLDNASTIGPTIARLRPSVTGDDLRDLRVPTAVLAGEDTRLYYRLIAERVASAIPQARMSRISGAAHMSIVERPAEAADAILSTLHGLHKAP